MCLVKKVILFPFIAGGGGTLGIWEDIGKRNREYVLSKYVKIFQDSFLPFHFTSRQTVNNGTKVVTKGSGHGVRDFLQGG